MYRLGRLIHEVIEREGLTKKAVAQRATEAAWFLFGESTLEITPNRVSKLIEAYCGPSAKGSARWVRDWELMALSHCLHFSLDSLHLKQRRPVFWDPLANEDYALEVVSLLKKHQDAASEFWGWSEFLPCSLETPEFMSAHHRALFDEIPGTSEWELKKVLRLYDEIGSFRRSQFLDGTRHWKMTVLMLLSDLQRIAERRDEYRNISKRIVQTCLLNVARLIRDHDMKLDLFIAKDSEVSDLMPFLRESDSKIVIGDSLSLGRDHRGTVLWSEDPKLVHQQRATFASFAKRASFKTKVEVAAKLEALANR